jgi:hypothetical protein
VTVTERTNDLAADTAACRQRRDELVAELRRLEGLRITNDIESREQFFEAAIKIPKLRVECAQAEVDLLLAEQELRAAREATRADVLRERKDNRRRAIREFQKALDAASKAFCAVQTYDDETERLLDGGQVERLTWPNYDAMDAWTRYHKREGWL